MWGPGKWAPAIDVAEDDKELTVRAEVPGIDPKDLDVTVAGGQLVLSGEKKESSESKNKGFYQSETRYGSFRRAVPLPEGVDTENVDAQYANGVLTLHLAKTAPAGTKRIEVKVK
jgi:HSP20 family protein